VFYPNTRDDFLPADHCIGIEHDLMVYFPKEPSDETPDRTIDAAGKAVKSGFIDSHYLRMPQPRPMLCLVFWV
jgi:dihydroorotase-like cyclic amidohydrolase